MLIAVLEINSTCMQCLHAFTSLVSSVVNCATGHMRSDEMQDQMHLWHYGTHLHMFKSKMHSVPCLLKLSSNTYSQQHQKHSMHIDCRACSCES